MPNDLPSPMDDEEEQVGVYPSEVGEPDTEEDDGVEETEEADEDEGGDDLPDNVEEGEVAGYGALGGTFDEDDEDDSEPFMPEGMNLGGGGSANRGESMYTGSTVRRVFRAAGDFNELVTKLGMMGRQVKVAINRLKPEEILEYEGGTTQFYALPQQNPKPEDVIEWIHRRFGGGEYEVFVKSGELARDAEATVRVRLHGDPKPLTFAGRQFLAEKYAAMGMPPPFYNAPAEVSPPGPAPHSDSNDERAALYQMLIEQQRMVMAQMNQRDDRDDRKEARSENTAVAAMQTMGMMMAQAMSKPEPKKDNSAAIQLVASLATAALPGLMQFFQRQSELRVERENRQREDDRVRWKEMMEAQKNPLDPAAIMQTVMGMMEGPMKSVMSAQAGISKGVMETYMEMIRDVVKGSDDSFMGAITSAVKEGGPALLQNLPMMLARGAPPAMPPGMQQPPTPQAAPGLPGASPPEELIRQAAQHQAQVAEQAAQAAQAAQQKAQAAQQQAQEGAPAQPSPAAIAEMNFLFLFATHVQNRTEPEVAWDYEYEGQTMKNLFGVSPEPFRDAVLATLDSDKPEEMVAAKWIEKAPLPPQGMEVVRALDEDVLGQDEKARSHAADIIDACPFLDDGDDEEAGEAEKAESKGGDA